MGTMAKVAALAVGGWLLSKQLKKRREPGSNSGVKESIDVDVPVSAAYNQWTQFEEFPKFMDNVESIQQIDDTHLRWRANIGGKTKEWVAEITEQTPDQRIAWRSTEGLRNAGVVTFHKLSDNRTRVMLQMDYEPEDMTEKIGDALGGVRKTARGNLKRFKERIESQGHESGAWRGTVTRH
ncbi:SRPBCC family protein [Ramlibacter rhizophilus]|uniref:SRPBCC family protein n=1 Tax=Ramlibacter rhizophilus TaxID=1781167 RepID=A0A4Z0BH66_9BURK|nr:SRPBCC family protein [Ramlibacter rhizophilus]TFY98655.1 SRPBCC family protein [Ramlibacter rhizophilus]